LSALLFLFNPGIIYLSSIWGQYGSLYIFFLLLSTYLLKKKNLFLAIFCFSLSLLIKPQSLVIAPIFLLLFAFFKKGRGIFKAILIFVFPWLLIIPFIEDNLALWLMNYFQKLGSVGTTAMMSSAAFNFWSLLGGFHLPVDLIFFYFSLRFWGLFFFTLFYLGLFFIFFKRVLKRRKIDYFYFFGLLFLVFFIFAPQVHERYLLPTIVFLSVGALKNLKRLFLYLILSLSFLANLSFSLEKYLPAKIDFNFIRFWKGQNLNLMPKWGYIFAILNLSLFLFFYRDFLLKNK